MIVGDLAFPARPPNVAHRQQGRFSGHGRSCCCRLLKSGTFEPTAPPAVPHKGYPILHVEFEEYELLFGSAAQIEHYIDVLNRKALPTTRHSGRSMRPPVRGEKTRKPGLLRVKWWTCRDIWRVFTCIAQAMMLTAWPPRGANDSTT
jgi:hypothetical protein